MGPELTRKMRVTFRLSDSGVGPGNALDLPGPDRKPYRSRFYGAYTQDIVVTVITPNGLHHLHQADVFCQRKHQNFAHQK